jgi:hypothetical protein
MDSTDISEYSLPPVKKAILKFGKKNLTKSAILEDR